MAQLTILLDGLCDQPLQDLQGLTPLEKIPHPVIDQMVENSGVEWASLGSGRQRETALLEFCGIKAPEHLPLAPLELAYCGHFLAEDEIALGLRFVSTGQQVVIEVADELLSDQEGRLFCSLLAQVFPEIKIYHLYGPRAVIVVKEKEWKGCAFFENSWNPINAIGQRWDKEIKDERLRLRLNEAVEILDNHEVNLLRDELEEPLVNGVLFGELGTGRVNIKSKYNIDNWCFYSSWPSMIGVARSIELNTVVLPEEPYRFANVELLIKELPEILNCYEHAIVDLPYLWKSTYKGDLLEKLKTIEWLDRFCLSPVLKFCNEYSHQLQVLPLRLTDIRKGTTIAGAVPLIKGPKMKWKENKTVVRESF